MLKKSKKGLAIILTLAMLATLLVAAPVSAKSVNSVDKVLAYSDTYVGATSTLTIQEDSDFKNHFVAGDTFTLRLPSPIKWDKNTTQVNWKPNGAFAAELLASGDARIINDQTMEIKFPAGANAPTAGQDFLDVVIGVDVNGASGEIQITIDPIDSAVTGGSYTFLVVGSGKATVTSQSQEKIGRNAGSELGTIEIRENNVGAIPAGSAATFTVKLPSNFEWNGMKLADISLSGGLSNAKLAAIVGEPLYDGRTMKFTVTPVAGASQRGVIYITPKVKALKDAQIGDVSVSVVGDSGSTQICDADVVAGEYVDWGTVVKVKEVKELISGKFEQKTEEITIEENVSGTLIANRDDLNVELPDWVKITNISWTNPTGGLAATKPSVGKNLDIDGEENEFDIPITTATKNPNTGKIKFTLELSIEANKTGDITAVFSGAGLEKTELVVAKAIAPVTATADVKDVLIGTQGQEVGDLIIAETKKETIKKYNNITANNKNGELIITLTEGARFTATPKAEVIEGNLEIKEESVRLQSNDTELLIPIDSESTTPSKIKVSGIKLTVDRSVAEGAIKAKVRGSAINENYRNSLGWIGGASAKGDAKDLDAGEFDTWTVVAPQIARVITPAPTDVKSKVSFVIGETKYTANGVEKTMDVASYINNDRTYLPVRYVASALGVADSNILWNDSDKTATLIKGDKVVQLKVGDSKMLVNGVGIEMGVAPEISSERTMLPFRFIAQAFGASVAFDDVTKTVTMEL